MADVKCPDCGDVFDLEAEGTGVRSSRRAWKDVCLNCREAYRFDCGVCEEWCDRDPEANEIGSDVFAMVRACPAMGHEGDLQPGLYRILRGPFVFGPILGEPYIDARRVERVGGIPTIRHLPETACAPVCEDCQRKLIGCVRHMRRRAA